MPSWRYWLIDLPATITEVGMTWYRLLFMALLWCAAIGAVGGMLMALLVLVLYLFGS